MQRPFVYMYSFIKPYFPVFYSRFCVGESICYSIYNFLFCIRYAQHIQMGSFTIPANRLWSIKLFCPILRRIGCWWACELALLLFCSLLLWFVFISVSVDFSISFFFHFSGTLCAVFVLCLAPIRISIEMKQTNDERRLGERGDRARVREGDSFFLHLCWSTQSKRTTDGVRQVLSIMKWIRDSLLASTRVFRWMPFSTNKNIWYNDPFTSHYSNAAFNFSNVSRCSLLCSLQNANVIFFYSGACSYGSHSASSTWLHLADNLLNQIELNAQERCALIRIRGDCLYTYKQVDAHTVTDVWSYAFNKRTKRHQLK